MLYPRRNTTRLALPIAVLAVATLSPAARAQVQFNLIHDSTIDARALAGFQQAADLWSSRLTNPITVNLQVGYAPLSGNVIGQAQSSEHTYAYGGFRSALASNATSALDASAVSSLEAGPSYGFAINGTTDAFYGLHQGASSLVCMTNANAKALGLYSASDAYDASITFSSTRTFDFDRKDGIASDAYDFVGVAAHEIGHALGFVSGVDWLDDYSFLYTTTDATLDAHHDALDLFRYSMLNGVATRSFLSGNRHFGNTPTQYPAYFSTGGTSGPEFSTGAYRGDGRQASHWKDDTLTGTRLGIMDPTGSPGDFLTSSENDFAAFDAIGYNVAPVPVPEPASLAALGLGLVALLRRRRS